MPDRSAARDRQRQEDEYRQQQQEYEREQREAEARARIAKAEHEKRILNAKNNIACYLAEYDSGKLNLRLRDEKSRKLVQSDIDTISKEKFSDLDLLKLYPFRIFVGFYSSFTKPSGPLHFSIQGPKSIEDLDILNQILGLPEFNKSILNQVVFNDNMEAKIDDKILGYIFFRTEEVHLNEVNLTPELLKLLEKSKQSAAENFSVKKLQLSRVKAETPELIQNTLNLISSDISPLTITLPAKESDILVWTGTKEEKLSQLTINKVTDNEKIKALINILPKEFSIHIEFSDQAFSDKVILDDKRANSLKISNQDLSPSHFANEIFTSNIKSLSKLELFNINFTQPETKSSLLEAIKKTSLTELTLKNCQLNDKDLESLQTYLKENTKLISLDLTGNKFSPKALEGFAAYLQENNSSLTEIRIDQATAAIKTLTTRNSQALELKQKCETAKNHLQNISSTLTDEKVLSEKSSNLLCKNFLEGRKNAIDLDALVYPNRGDASKLKNSFQEILPVLFRKIVESFPQDLTQHQQAFKLITNSDISIDLESYASVIEDYLQKSFKHLLTAQSVNIPKIQELLEEIFSLTRRLRSNPAKQCNKLIFDFYVQTLSDPALQHKLLKSGSFCLDIVEYLDQTHHDQALASLFSNLKPATLVQSESCIVIAKGLKDRFPGKELPYLSQTYINRVNILYRTTSKNDADDVIAKTRDILKYTDELSRENFLNKDLTISQHLEVSVDIVKSFIENSNNSSTYIIPEQRQKLFSLLDTISSKNKVLNKNFSKVNEQLAAALLGLYKNELTNVIINSDEKAALTNTYRNLVNSNKKLGGGRIELLKKIKLAASLNEMHNVLDTYCDLITKFRHPNLTIALGEIDSRMQEKHTAFSEYKIPQVKAMQKTLDIGPTGAYGQSSVASEYNPSYPGMVTTAEKVFPNKGGNLVPHNPQAYGDGGFAVPATSSASSSSISSSASLPYNSHSSVPLVDPYKEVKTYARIKEKLDELRKFDPQLAQLNSTLATLDLIALKNLQCQGSGTGELMTDPVIAADGHTYERTFIENWIKEREKTGTVRSPFTLQPLPHLMLIPNETARAAIIALLDKALKAYAQPQVQASVTPPSVTSSSSSSSSSSQVDYNLSGLPPAPRHTPGQKQKVDSLKDTAQNGGFGGFTQPLDASKAPPSQVNTSAPSAPPKEEQRTVVPL